MERKAVSFREYVREILKTSTYKPGEDKPCVVAFAEVLPGCITQGDSFEDAREQLVDAIETWVLSAVKDGDPLPVINGLGLALSEPTEDLGELAHG